MITPVSGGNLHHTMSFTIIVITVVCKKQEVWLVSSSSCCRGDSMGESAVETTVTRRGRATETDTKHIILIFFPPNNCSNLRASTIILLCPSLCFHFLLLSLFWHTGSDTPMLKMRSAWWSQVWGRSCRVGLRRLQSNLSEGQIRPTNPCFLWTYFFLLLFLSGRLLGTFQYNSTLPICAANQPRHSTLALSNPHKQSDRPKGRHFNSEILFYIVILVFKGCEASFRLTFFFFFLDGPKDCMLFNHYINVFATLESKILEKYNLYTEYKIIAIIIITYFIQNLRIWLCRLCWSFRATVAP